MLFLFIHHILARASRLDAPHGQPCVAFTSKSLGKRTVLTTYVWRGGHIIAKLEGPFQVRQYVAPWKAIALAQGSKVFSWVPGRAPHQMLDLAPYLSGMGRGDYSIFSISPTGKEIAFLDRDQLKLVSLQSNKARTLVDTKAISRMSRTSSPGITLLKGLCWNRAGTVIAVSLPSKPMTEMSDQESRPICYTVTLKRSVRRVGNGSPIAWTSDEVLLCADYATTAARLDDVEPVTYNLQTGIARRLERVGCQVGWDGTRIILGRNRELILWKPGFRRLSASFQVPEYLDPRNKQPLGTLVGIPPTSTIDRHFSKDGAQMVVH